MLRSLPSRVRLFVTPRTVAHQAPLSIGILRQGCWSGWPCPPPEDLPNPGIEPRSPTLQADSLPSEPPRKKCFYAFYAFFLCFYAFFPCDFNSQCNSISNLHSSDLTFLLITRLIHIPSCSLYLASWHAICRLACSGKISLRKRIPSIL